MLMKRCIMRNEKRKQRKADKQRRKNKLAGRHRPPTGTITNYGKDGRVEYMGVVVHRNSQVVASRVFHAKDFLSGEAFARAAFDYALRHGAAKIMMLEELQPP